MMKIAGYLTKNRSEKDQKIAQSTHENEYIMTREKLLVEIQNSFSKQFLWKKGFHVPGCNYSADVTSHEVSGRVNMPGS